MKLDCSQCKTSKPPRFFPGTLHERGDRGHRASVCFDCTRHPEVCGKCGEVNPSLHAVCDLPGMTAKARCLVRARRRAERKEQRRQRDSRARTDDDPHVHDPGAGPSAA